MAMTTYQKAAAWAVVQALFAGCSAGTDNGGSSTSSTSSTSGSSPAPSPVVAQKAPAITTQPASVSAVAVGATVTFTVVATGTSPFYQWYKAVDGVSTPVNGATSATYTTPALSASDDGTQYTVTAYNSVGRVTSAAATVSMAGATSAPPPAPVSPPAPTPAPAPAPAPAPGPAPAPAPVTSVSITAQPVSVSVITGGTATFTVAALGTSPTYQWNRNGTGIAGATSASYTTPAATYLDSNSTYSVTVANSAGTVTSSAATLTLALSADQTAFESFALASNGGVHELDWELQAVGAQASGTDWVTTDFAQASLSPLTNGPQFETQSHTTSLAAHLADVLGGPSRYLNNGAIVLVAGDQNSFNVSYVGSSVRVDELAADNTTVAYSQMRSNYTVTALSGLLHAAPTAILQPYNAIFANPGVLDTTTNWATGAAFLTYTATEVGDRYAVFDCEASTTGATPSSCTTSATTLTAFMTAGFFSNSDNVNYTLANGSIVTVGGVPIWVATAPRPQSSVGNATVQHRIYFQLNGNIYTGALTQDGATLDDFHYYTDANNVSGTKVYLNYQIRLNQAAVNSLAAAMLL